MNSDHVGNPSGLQRPARFHTRRGRGRAGGAAPAEDRIRLDTIGRTISILDATTNPYLGHLMSEDVCWRFAHEQWLATRPSRSDRQQWQRWQDEGEWLRDKRVRIENLARNLNLPPQPAPRLPWHRRVLRALRGLFRS